MLTSNPFPPFYSYFPVLALLSLFLSGLLPTSSPGESQPPELYRRRFSHMFGGHNTRLSTITTSAGLVRSSCAGSAAPSSPRTTMREKVSYRVLSRALSTNLQELIGVNNYPFFFNRLLRVNHLLRHLCGLTTNLIIYGEKSIYVLLRQ